MPNYDELKAVRTLSKRGDTNSKVDLLQEENTENFYVRKAIFGIDQPLYQAIFVREIRALYKLNSCDNVVKILSHKNMQATKTGEKVGCIFLEYIFGETLSEVNLTKLSPKDKFSIMNQLLTAIEVAHSNGIIHRDINPNNIMISDENVVKVIDFGVCKIKEMISKSTVYQMATNLYSAPEVHLHSENATEKSDLYSIGAVIFFMFTGRTPPAAPDFQNVLDNTSGIDIDLKPIVKKLVSENPEQRYKDIFELRIDLANLFFRFLNVNLQINVTMDFEKFKFLKQKKLIPQSAKISDTSFISQNFMELYAFKASSEIYQFLGLNFMMECLYDVPSNVYKVTAFKKIVPIEREGLKRRFAEVTARVQIIDPKFVHRQSKNDSQEIKNIVDAYYDEFMSNNNVNLEYKSKYGAWRELLELMKKSIENNIMRFSYDAFSFQKGLLIFSLSKGTFLSEEPLTCEQAFVYEKHSRIKKKTNPLLIGYYQDDYYDKDHVVLKIRSERGRPTLPSKGVLCLDYRKDMANVQRQLDALDTIEKEDYSCPFSLKKIIAGVESPTNKILEDKFKFCNGNLDMSQQAAVQKALNSESLFIIQGPPGTGKTHVVIEIIRQILKDNVRNIGLPEKKILLVSQSHPAVDKMLDDLIKQTPTRPNLIRIGRDEKLNDGIREEYGLNYVKERWVTNVRAKCENVSAELLCKLQIDKNEFDNYYAEFEKVQVADIEKTDVKLNVIADLQSKTQNPTKDKLRKILEIQRQWTELLPQYDDADLYIIKSTTIIAGTCTGFISNRVIRDADFDYLIIDEAAKATFPELAVSFNKAGKIIMVGDHQQLPPVLDNDLIQQNKSSLDVPSLSEGIFEKLYKFFPEENRHRLTVQYRMHPAIGTLISHVFYDNDIQNGIEKEKRVTGIEDYADIAIEWISTSSKQAKDRFEKAQGSAPRVTYRNELEIKIIREKLDELDSKVGHPIKVAVITAYSGQKYALTNMVNQQKYHYLQIEVDTVDAFQGSQKEIIIYSTVRSSDSPYKIGFLKSEARLNVAFSRAQSLLIIVGDHKFLNNTAVLKNKFPDILAYIENNNFCRITEY